MLAGTLRFTKPIYRSSEMSLLHNPTGQVASNCTKNTRRQRAFQSVPFSRRGIAASAHHGDGPTDVHLSRREAVVSPLLLSSLAALATCTRPALAEIAAEEQLVAGGQLSELYDEILAYRFQYPVSTASGKPLKMIMAHYPEKYSSAAPLTADARQRIVCELLDLRNFVSVSVTVGPASGVLKGVDPAQWKPFDVALTVLVDRSTSRLTTGQRTALNDVEEARVEDRDNGRYFVYEHLSQGSPTLQESARRETYRHALAVTAVRPDGQGTPFLYTLNLSCRQEMWDDLQPLFKQAVDSFRLTTPTDKYVSPDTNPWQFWCNKA